MKKIYIFIISLMPMAVLAQTSQIPTTTTGCPPITNLGSVFDLGTCIINKSVLPLLITLALAVFVYGGVQFIRNADNEEERKKGKDFMIYGIIALFVIVSVWGLVNVLISTFGFKNVLPTLPTSPH